MITVISKRNVTPLPQQLPVVPPTRLPAEVLAGVSAGLLAGRLPRLTRLTRLVSGLLTCLLKGLLPALLACLLIFRAGPVVAAPERYAIDPEHATVAFLVDHVGFAKVLGRFTEHDGTLVWDGEARTLSDLVVNVKTASVATDHEKRDEHVRGKDFLYVKQHPEMSFAMEGSVVVGDGPVEVAGMLTLRGETRPATLEVTLNKFDKYPFGHKKDTLGASARGSVLRSEYGMTYAVGNGLVGDRVDLIIEVEAIRQ